MLNEDRCACNMWTYPCAVCVKEIETSKIWKGHRIVNQQISSARKAEVYFGLSPINVIMAGYRQLATENLEKQKTVADYDLCSEQNVTTLQKQEMKKCFGCRQNLPLGSGRYHYYVDSVEEVATVPCTHNPVTGVAYDFPNADGTLWDKYCPSPREVNIPTEFISGSYSVTSLKKYENTKINETYYNKVYLSPRCDCGGKIARTTHSDWCSSEKV